MEDKIEHTCIGGIDRKRLRERFIFWGEQIEYFNEGCGCEYCVEKIYEMLGKDIEEYKNGIIEYWKNNK